MTNAQNLPLESQIAMLKERITRQERVIDALLDLIENQTGSRPIHLMSGEDETTNPDPKEDDDSKKL